MKVIISKDENGYLNSLLDGPGLFIEGGIEVDLTEDEIKDIKKNLTSYFYLDGVVILDSEKKKFEDLDSQLNQLRKERETQCFPYINRGNLWYDSLTESQVEELKVWYNNWLDVTETLIVPENPNWLK